MKILKNIQNRRKDTTIYWSIKEELKNGIVRRIRKIFTFISDSVLSSNKNCEWKLRVGFMWARIGDEDLKWGRSECKSMMRRQLTYASFQTIFFFFLLLPLSFGDRSAKQWNSWFHIRGLIWKYLKKR